MAGQPNGSPRPRRDAERNRHLLVKAAGEVLAEQGIDASLNEIARRAGVGNATLYRHFPTRADLYAAIFAESDRTFEQVIEPVLDIEDGWTALRTYGERICELDATTRVAYELMMAGVPGAPSITEAKERGRRVMSELVGRARREGALRSDVTAEDVHILLCSVAVMVPSAADQAPDVWRRHLALVLDGLHVRAATELPDTPAPTAEQAHQIMSTLFRGHSGGDTPAGADQRRARGTCREAG